MANEHEPAQTPPADSSPETPEHEPTPAAEHEAALAPERAPTPPPEPVAPRPRETGAAFYAKLAALLFAVSYSIAFIVGNNRKIHVDFVFAETDVSLIWTILLLLGVGLVGGLLVSHLYRHHRRKKPRKP